jgi:hypothetical protein
MQQEKIQEIQSKAPDKPDPYRSVVTQWLAADHDRLTETVIRALMMGQNETP